MTTPRITRSSAERRGGCRAWLAPALAGLAVAMVAAVGLADSARASMVERAPDPPTAEREVAPGRLGQEAVAFMTMVFERGWVGRGREARQRRDRPG